ncbi:YbaL family putative K(+) efflux transporter [Belnapia mucosa]|uniref:YbaL family putative K(+) efflux transporter n=1 Tax=Belnapia mucosa TaxID=2804532 RepID=UPI002E28CD05|nr:YbaL family putative K(+) efflux transporter [Belnapia mucosa]
MHQTPLISTIAAGLVLAFGFGIAAHRLRISPLVGYLLAGIVVGPFTPGFVADQELASQLAEIGVILLLFAVGLHFSLADLISVRAVALPGAIAQLSLTTLLGMALGWSFAWSLGACFVFGLALACGSTVVLTKSLQERRLLDTDRGRMAVGWLIVQDLAMVIALVLLPTLGGAGDGNASWEDIATAVGVTIAKVAAFIALMLIAGRRLVPMILHYSAHTGSRELFRLAVYAIAIGVAYGAATLFGVSFAVGAFFAGMVLAESPLSQRATEEALPLRDAFAVLFFVSVGMLFNPYVLWERPWAVLATLALIVGGNGAAAFATARLLGQPGPTAWTIAASIAQIGEFSFILAGLGVGLGLLSPEGRDLILAGAILSILANPFLFAAVERGRVQIVPRSAPEPIQPTVSAPETQAGAGGTADGAASVPVAVTALEDHDVIVGYGRVGSLLGHSLVAAGRPILVFEEGEAAIAAARRDGAEVVVGNAADPEVLAAANLAAARRLLVTIPQAFEAGQVVQQARRANPALEIVARAHSDAEVQYLTQLGADLTVMGEREIAQRMIERALRSNEAPVPIRGAA